MKGLKLLLWKNFKIQARDRISTLVELLASTVIMGAFALMRYFISAQYVSSTTIYESFSTTTIPATIKFDSHMIFYTPTNPLIDSLIDTIDRDFFMSKGLNYTFTGFHTQDDLLQKYEDNIVKMAKLNPLKRSPVLGAIIFETIGSRAKNFPLHINYTIRLPSIQRTTYDSFVERANLDASWFTEVNWPFTQFGGPRSKNSRFGGFPGYFDEGFLYIQNAVEASIVKTLTNVTSWKAFNYTQYDFRLQRFPYGSYLDDKFNFVIHIWMPLLISLAFVYSVMMITKQIIHEKSSRLKEFMKIMGLSNWLHWTAWFIKSYAVLLVAALLMTIMAKVQVKDGLAVLQETSPVILYFVFAAHCFTIVGFSFFMSTLFSSEETGATAAGFLWVMVQFPYFSYFQQYQSMSFFSKMASCFLCSNVPLSYFFHITATFESDGRGLQWENFWEGATPGDTFSIGHVTLMMVINGLVYMIAAFYIELAFPGQYGVRLPWYFPFTKWYWTGKPRETHTEITANEPNRNQQSQVDAFEPEPDLLKVGVEILALTKVFGNKIAVNNLNLKMYQNQVTALLGHNGAGKTTTMSILTGLIRPSGGTAIVNSFDIRKDMPAIRDSLGLCPQYNVLFDNLTVEEHLGFYCQLKGYDAAQTMEEIDRCLHVLDLEGKRHSQAKTLSGGMKRKLCVGMAFSANSKVVLLDEPTAGMDPGARRSTWDLIQEQKFGKTVILSTHYMEEADLLGDRVAIMAEGQLQCNGSPLFLKSKYGGAYDLVIVKKDNSPADSSDYIRNTILRIIPEAQFKQNIGSELSCILPNDCITLFSTLFEELEGRKEELSIESFGVKSTTMEEIFIRVGEAAEDQKSRKRRRHSSSSIIQIPTTQANGQAMQPKLQHSLDLDNDKDRNEGKTLWLRQMQAMLTKKFLYHSRNRSLLCLQIIVPTAVIAFALCITSSAPGWNNSTPLKISLESVQSLKEVKTPISCLSPSQICDGIRYYTKQHPGFVLEEVLDDSVDSYLQDLSRNSASVINSKYMLGLEEQNISNGKGNSSKSVTVFFNNQPLHIPPLAVNFLYQGILRSLGHSHQVTVNNYPLDRHGIEQLQSSVNVFGKTFIFGYCSTVGMAFLSGAFVIFPIHERVIKSKHLQFIAGIKLPIFWAANFLVDMMFYMIASVFVLVNVFVFNLPQYRPFDMMVRFLVLFLFHGWAVIPLSMFLSTILKNPTATYCRVVAMSFTISILSMYVVSLLRTPSFNMADAMDTLHRIFLAHPGYGLGVGVMALGNNYNAIKFCAMYEMNMTTICRFDAKFVCCALKQENYFAWEDFGVGRNIVYMTCFGAFFLIKLITTETGIFKKLYAEFKRLIGLAQMKSDDADSDNMEFIDADVLNERKRIMNSTLQALSATDNLVVRDLKKVYDGNFVAVNRLTFGVKKREVFGLLGSNGAGKTTTFKMLTGDISITHGDAYANSFSIKTNLRNARAQMGYCPQFDACIEQLTGRETLTMFARLKGIPEKNIPPLVERVAGNLLFTKFLDRQFGKYSGGNKRKLSTALAMLGDPAIIFLDEPTAGMDPVARRHVWDAISLIREGGPSVILTSHNMEECEALCNKLVIMVKGRFQCLGSPQHLKTKLCPVYKLVVQLPFTVSQADSNNGIVTTTNWDNLRREFRKFLKSKFPGCSLKDSHPGFLEYQLPVDETTLSKIFATMEEAKVAFALEAYSVGQTDLEQVFFNYARI